MKTSVFVFLGVSSLGCHIITLALGTCFSPFSFVQGEYLVELSSLERIVLALGLLLALAPGLGTRVLVSFLIIWKIHPSGL
jgi:hypothetical protein